MNHTPCGASSAAPRPLTAPETGAVIVIVVIAVGLAVAGLEFLSMAVLVAEATTLGIRLLRRLRSSSISSNGSRPAPGLTAA
ncbi:hypothetical protein [Streptomyces sp. NRRL F-2580]|uniref:hypothetical protein n=1 Tax=Streptomyces sp. NRRL F-2580 TaxID=1463841 RepID=UPI00131DDAB9|nr:hypothetical protein [Streptomyces sp. NRRL F-2580]